MFSCNVKILQFMSFCAASVEEPVISEFDYNFELSSIIGFFAAFRDFFNFPKLTALSDIKKVVTLLMLLLFAILFTYLVISFINRLFRSKKFPLLVFKFSPYVFFITWIPTVVYFIYSIRDYKMVPVSISLLSGQFCVFLIIFSLSLLLLLLIAFLFNLIGEQLLDCIVMFLIIFLIVTLFYLKIELLTICFVTVLFSLGCLFYIFFDPVNDYMIKQNLFESLHGLFPGCVYIIPFFLCISLVNYTQMSVLKNVFYTFSQTSTSSQSFVEIFPDLFKTFIFFFLLSWTMFILKYINKLFTAYVYKAKSENEQISIVDTLRLIFSRFNLLCYYSLISGLLLSLQFIISVYIIPNVTTKNYNLNMLFFTALGIIFTLNFKFIYRYCTTLFHYIALDLNSIYSVDTKYSESENINYDIAVANTLPIQDKFDVSTQSNITSIFNTTHRAFLAFLPYIPYLLVLILDHQLGTEYSTYIFILFVCTDFFIDMLSLIGSIPFFTTAN